ncbi:hypothetical protein TNCT_247731 [Trichonephila clavata]|uniref:DUF5641 domain-containing protein n=1 Tax=Trichonephila clavata TaxID=2740835 RepID=A0A8X6FVA9_TRICU|nr:hypothetical protein TNCT_247731 [Trichonephila clavata]
MRVRGSSEQQTPHLPLGGPSDLVPITPSLFLHDQTEFCVEDLDLNDILGNKKRVDWPLAKIIEIYKGRDGVSRVARLKTQSGEIIRPIQRSCRLETSGKIAEIMREPITTPEDVELLSLKT